MLTRMVLRNLKLFDEVDIELGSPVVFVGPNNSGKTTALQALALWDVGVKRWSEKHVVSKASKRPGVTINRRDLLAVPVPDTNLLWHNCHVRDVRRDSDATPRTQNIRVEIIVEGVDSGASWRCGMEFDYANAESLYCRPLRLPGTAERMTVPKEAANLRVAFLPPMSGLASNETKLDVGAVNVLLGEGRTAEVLRNLCYQVAQRASGATEWDTIVRRIRDLFGVTLEPPVYLAERGEIAMAYRDSQGTRLDLSASGRGLQQTLLLLTHMAINPGSTPYTNAWGTVPDLVTYMLNKKHWETATLSTCVAGYPMTSSSTHIVLMVYNDGVTRKYSGHTNDRLQVSWGNPTGATYYRVIY